MTYNTVNEMAQSQSLIARVAACAAALGNIAPRNWAASNILTMVATADASLQTTWVAAQGNPNANPDTGFRTDVVTDAMILTAVTALKNSQGVDQGWPATTTAS